MPLSTMAVSAGGQLSCVCIDRVGDTGDFAGAERDSDISSGHQSNSDPSRLPIPSVTRSTMPSPALDATSPMLSATPLLTASTAPLPMSLATLPILSLKPELLALLNTLPISFSNPPSEAALPDAPNSTSVADGKASPAPLRPLAIDDEVPSVKMLLPIYVTPLPAPDRALPKPDARLEPLPNRASVAVGSAPIPALPTEDAPEPMDSSKPPVAAVPVSASTPPATPPAAAGTARLPAWPTPRAAARPSAQDGLSGLKA